MNIEADYIGTSLELSKPICAMGWNEATERAWPDGWRMPTRAELVTLYDEATDSGYDFSDMSVVWSASSYAPDPTDAWHVYFDDGYSYADDKTLGYAVRLVREVKK